MPSSSSSSIARAGEERLDLDRHQQLEQGAADLRVAVLVVRGDLDQLVDEPRLRRLAAHLGARALGVERVVDRRTDVALVVAKARR